MKAILFDMDGVLVDSEPQHYKALNRMLQETQGFTLNWEQYARFIGTTNDKMWQILEDERPMQGTRETRQAAFADARDTIDREEGFFPVPGAPKLVRALQEKGAVLAVASSSSPDLIRMTLQGLGILDCFSLLVSGEQVQNPKPAPDIFLLAARLLGRSPADCLVVEDSTAGVRAAKAAGMACAALANPNSGTQDLAPADCILPAFDEGALAEILRLAGA